MQTGISPSLAALTLCVAVTAFAQQTPAPATIPSRPTPDATGTQARPPYLQQPEQLPAERKTPQTTLPPVVAPAQPSEKAPFTAYMPFAPEGRHVYDRFSGSVYIPVDSWMYPALTRLYSMGYLDTMFLGMRPWTRRSVLHMLQESESAIVHSNNEEAQEMLAKLLTELETEIPAGDRPRGLVYGVESSYTRLMGIGGPVLRDSFHLGQTLNNDYGRPYATGFNALAGASTVEEWGPFSLYVRGEYQHAPATTGYSNTLASLLSNIDTIPYAPPNAPQDTIPAGQLASQNPFRLVEASVSAHLLKHEISLGKTDAWLGPAQGGAMAWSNNAENIYSFRVNRVEPLHIKWLSSLIGPVRYDFFLGSLKGHTAPNDPWVHSAMFSFRPTRDLEFGFQRTVIFGGAGHAPVTLHTFLKSFFDISDSTKDEKYSRNDPGARYSDFNFSYRLPFARRFATLYMDSIAHDDVTPISAPRRAAYRTGLYLSRIPKIPKLDFRVEAVTTDPGVSRSQKGTFNYWETVQRQGYTNKGLIMGDWIGREAKGGQAWLTYHLSGNEWVQFEYLNKKTPKDFIPGGTTQNEYKISVLKRLRPDVELNAWVQVEGWKAPVPVNGTDLFKTGLQRNAVGAAQLTWYPKLHGSAQ